MGKIRMKERALYESSLYEEIRPEIEKDMENSKSALKMLKDYHAMPGKARSGW